MASTETVFSKELQVGKGKVYFDVQLLSLQFYSEMDNILLGQASAGGGMQLGRVKDALIWNGIPTVDPRHPRKARKPIYVEHPEWYGGKKKEFRLYDSSSPLNDDNSPRVNDAEFMAYLGDRVALEVAKANPGLDAKYGNIVQMLERLAGLAPEEEASEEEGAAFNPAFEGDVASASVEDEEEVAVGAGNPTA